MRIRLSLLVILSVMLIACRQGRLSSAQMQQKLDSIARLENLEQLERFSKQLDIISEGYKAQSLY